MKTLFCFFCVAGLLGTFAQGTQADPQNVQPTPIVTVTTSGAETAEGTSEPGVFTIKRTGPTDDSLVVFYRTSGSAADGVDYKKLPSSVLIPGGAASLDIPVVAIDDVIAEEEEKVVLTLVSPIRPLGEIRPLVPSAVSVIYGYQIGEPGSAALSIKDNDANVNVPTISIAATLPEAAEEGPKNGEFIVSRLGSMNAALAVEYEIVIHSINWPPNDVFIRAAEFPIFLLTAAQNGTDYKTLSGSVLIPTGAKSAKILLEPVNDQLLESREHVTLRLKPSAAYNINAPDTATVFILDNDPNAATPRVKIAEPANGSIFPLEKEIHITAQAEASQGFVKTVEFFANDKSLGITENNPLSASPMNPFQLMWKDAAPGEHVLTAKAMDDAGRITLSDPVHIKVLDSATATVVAIYASVPEASESDPNRSGIFRAVRTGDLKTKLNVHYLITGSAQNGIDYDDSGTVTIPIGESSAPIVIKAVPDKALEGNETVTLTLEQRVYILPPPPEEDYIVGEPKSATGLIVENLGRGFPPKVDIIQPKEGDVFAERATIKVEIQTADADGYVPRVELYDGDRLIDSETRNFLVKPPPGEIEHFVFEWKDASAGEHKLIAKATDDSGLSSTSSPVRIRIGRETILPVPVVTITARDREASEADPKNTATFQVHRSGRAQTELHVYYEIGGNAENGVDYEKLPGMVTIPAGDDNTRIVVLPIPDQKQEGKEQATLTLVQRVFIAPPGPEDNYQVGSPRTATAVISDSPGPNEPPKVAILSPQNGAEFPFRANIEIKAEASDADGKVKEVAFYADGRLLGSDSNPSFHFVWKDPAAGKHELRAKATDDGGAGSMSEPVMILVRERTPAGFVKRDLPDIYVPGETFKVVLEASPADTVQVYAVEERLPRGWTVSNINEGGSFDPASQEVKFGPFFDNKARTLSYEVTPPADESGPKEFSGLASANGVNSEITGDDVITSRSNRHPADLDPADNRITIKELTAYALAWKTGKEWSVGPNPIPQSYVTRAGEIWRRGEAYTFDPSQGPAPLWWVPKPSAALLTLDSAIVTAAGVTDRRGRAMRSFERVGHGDRFVYLVTLTVLPKPGVNAYTLEEHPPAGWAVSEVSDDGIFHNASGRIRWGIFLDDQTRTLTYHVTPAADHGHNQAVFEGVASLDGLDEPVRSDKEPDHGKGQAAGKLKNIHRHSTGECEVSFSVGAGHGYKIQVSTNLMDWTDLSSVVKEAGELQVFDTDAANSPVRYYRAILAN